MSGNKRKTFSETIGGVDNALRPAEEVFLKTDPSTVSPISPSTPKPINPSLDGESEGDQDKKININIGLTRHYRLNQIASRMRSRNSDAVPPDERIYPQHLIHAAVDLMLSSSDIDLSQITKLSDLRKYVASKINI